MLSPSDVQRYRDDGVVCLPGALSPDQVRIIEEAFEWTLREPGSLRSDFYTESDARFIQTIGDSSAEPLFRQMFEHTPLVDIASGLFAGGPVWYFEEQVWLKEGSGHAAARRTPWHQDTSYEPMGGAKAVVFWIPLDVVPAEFAIETVRKSHLGVTYNGTKFDPADDTEPFYADSDMPRLPDIEATRDQWDIVSWPMAPGDVLVFHPGTLHGGGGASPGGRRRSLSIRMFGDDVLRVPLSTAPTEFDGTNDHTASASRTTMHMDRYWALPIGAPLHQGGSTLLRA